MATKRKPLHSTPRMNFRSNNIGDNNAETKGTRPTAAPTSVQEVIVVMILHACKKIIFYNTNLKVGIYLGAVFLISLISDYAPFPKTYLSKSNNIFNLYFVKIGWLWTLLLAVPFTTLTAYTYCCGDRKLILRNHLLRLGVATGFWFVMTKSFNYVETNYGWCNVKGYETKSQCLKGGFIWNGFDISGHTFILIYSSLVLMEEAKAIVGWEGIREHIRNEEHIRSQRELQLTSNPLRYLRDNELNILKESFTKLTPYIRALFVGMTILQILWDVMLVSTMLYYHIMIEKFIGAVLAILVWYFTYRFWYAQLKIFPVLPGIGLFKYQQIRKQAPVPAKRSSISSPLNNKQVPKFMGMPLYGLKNLDEQLKDNLNDTNLQS